MIIFGDCAAINELELYNTNNDKISYEVIYTETYDSHTDGYPYYWTNMSYWNYTNLYDGNTLYTSNTQGGQNATSFAYKSSAESGKWARFIVHSNDYIEMFRLSIGNSEGRVPKEISIYAVNEYTEETYNNNIKQRNNEGLTLINTLQFDKVISLPTWYWFTSTEIGITPTLYIIEVYDHLRK